MFVGEQKPMYVIRPWRLRWLRCLTHPDRQAQKLYDPMTFLFILHFQL